ncbi:hypothetical protein [Salibacterium qingdaonense]|uniref:Uncharacterized protein n=1 Tax=Salibacterium qingdaonense TaxID=266892 RepID=A0A1I4NME4_9BACI|nr:hypothetical protein [Salibacterium qingdaonense]SFM16525.1 hypothetical protein SAMN04488054_1197 [Salibacterium qingdaonense]
MKPIYMLGTVIMICFAIFGAAGVIFLYDSEEEADPQKERSTEELAAELDEALGVNPPAEEETLEDNSTDSSPETPKDNRTARQTPDTDKASDPSTDTPNVSSTETEREESNKKSDAISLGPEEGRISVDELLQRMEE